MLSRLTVCSAVLTVAIFVSLTGCGAPEGAYEYSADTKTLLPPARKAVEKEVADKFGTPNKAVAWLRMPLAFGGLSGTVTEIPAQPPVNGDVVTVLKIDFRNPQILIELDANQDGALALSEFSGELLAELISRGRKKDPNTGEKLTKFGEADADGNGKLDRDEILKAKVKHEGFITEIVDPLADADLVGKILHFVSGGHQLANNVVKVADVNPQDGVIKIWPPLQRPVETDVRVIVGFGDNLVQGRHHYMRHCMHCHGVSGDGLGPTAEYLNPRPRDYRQGKFKFASTLRNDRPQRADLHRTLRQGIPGTLMPSFALLSEQEVDQIIEYVRFLSMRGEYEGNLVARFGEFTEKVADQEYKNAQLAYDASHAAWLKNNSEGPEPKMVSRGEIVSGLLKPLDKQLEPKRFQKTLERAADDVADKWRDCETPLAQVIPGVPRIADSSSSRARGRILYVQKCALCHGKTGLGNGPQTLDYGQHPVTKENYAEPGLYDDWGFPIQPRNLTLGMYRGGRRPVDIYRRIHQGIPGTPMAGFSTFKDNEIWDLVNYVLSLPYPNEVLADDPQEKVATEVGKPEEPARVVATSAIGKP